MGGKALKLIIVLFILVLSIFLVSAQKIIQDADGDTVGDKYDGCPGTTNLEDIPIINEGTKYLGCSCEQIREKIDAQDECLDFFCVPGRPLEIRDRAFSFQEKRCIPDYCDHNDLYVMPKQGFPACINGYEDENYCQPNVTLNSELCINGTIGPKIEEIEPPIQEVRKEDKTQTVNQPVVVKKYDFAEEIFDLILEDELLKEYLGNPTREEFLDSVKEFKEKIDVEKASVIESREITGTKLNIPVMTLTIDSPDNKRLKKLVVFEKILTQKIKYEDLIFNIEPDERINNVFIWKFNSAQDVKIKYSSKSSIALESQTVIVADIKTVPTFLNWWPLILIPLFGYAAYRYMIRRK